MIFVVVGLVCGYLTERYIWKERPPIHVVVVALFTGATVAFAMLLVLHHQVGDALAQVLLQGQGWAWGVYLRT